MKTKMKLNIAEKYLIEMLLCNGPEKYNEETMELGAYKPVRQIYCRISEMVQRGILQLIPKYWKDDTYLMVNPGCDILELCEMPQESNKNALKIKQYSPREGVIYEDVIFPKGTTLGQMLAYNVGRTWIM